MSEQKRKKPSGRSVPVWFSPDDEADVRLRAQRQGLGMSAFMKKQALREPIIVYRDAPQYLTELNRIGVNLNQISKWANAYKESADAREVLSALVAIERQLSELTDAA